MQRSLKFLCALAAVTTLTLAPSFFAQSSTGSIDLSVHITPSGARPEPVRQFTFYVLTRSYADVVKDVSGQDPLPTRDQFIDALKCSPELKKWIKVHDIVDLTSPDIDKLLTTDDIMDVPEFFDAYERANSGGVTKGLPQPKYREPDKTANPEKYQKQKEEFLAATRKFIDTHPITVSGIELELTAVNPKTAWDNLHVEHKHRVAQLAPDTAQVKYLAAKADTDLDGRALISGLRPGNYWVSTLDMNATSGDRRLVWDVPVTVLAGAPTHLELSNINAVETPRTPTR